MKNLLLAFLLGVTILQAQQIRGKVTDGLNNISFARVVIQGSGDFVFSDFYGEFEIENVSGSDSLIISAWKEGFYNGESKALPGDTGVAIVLHSLPASDNQEYEFLSPHVNGGDELNCANCHSDVIMGQWQNNAHGQSAKNPFFYAMYNGTNLNNSDPKGVGFKTDFPDSDGNCTLCHIPSASLKTLQGVDPNTIAGLDTNGVFCDFCHKIKSTSGYAETGNNTKNYGLLSIDLLRPPAGEQIFFGPYVDVHAPDAFNPEIRKSEFCAPCHSGFFWNDYAYGSFVEWQQSDYPAMGIQCQTCHMAPDGVTTNFAPGKGGIERDISSIPSHLQPGSRDTTILKNSVTMTVEAEQLNDTLKVTVIITNDKTGHHVPTDRPSRNMILLVDAAGGSGNTLEFIGGERIPFWGGTGVAAEGNYADLPGKGFAKVLKENKFYNPRIPAPAWLEHSVYSDNRIAAFASDTSVYYFKLDNFFEDINISAKLLYRRFYKDWMDEKEFDIPDIEMEKENLVKKIYSVGVNDSPVLPGKFFLGQNYPNPFNPVTKVDFYMPETGAASLCLLDPNGSEVLKIFENKSCQAGWHSAEIDLSGFASGVYFYRLKGAQISEVKKMMLIK